MADWRAITENKILDDYISEPVHDQGTLERYLNLYPNVADALHDLHFAIRTRGAAAVDAADADDEAWLDAAVARISSKLGTTPVDPFQDMTADQLLTLRQKLGIRAGTLKGFCDRFVEVTTVPRHFLQDFANDLDRTLIEFLAYLAQPPKMAVNQSFRAEGRPSVPAVKITFARLLEEANESEETRNRLLEERD